MVTQLEEVPERDTIIFTICRGMAERSNLHYRHGAVLYKHNGHGQISYIAHGYNYRNPIMLRALRTIDPRYRNVHAEADILLNTRFDQRFTKNAILYLYGETRNGNLVHSKPCKLCQDLLRRMRIRRVYYSTRNYQIEVWDVKKG